MDLPGKPVLSRDEVALHLIKAELKNRKFLKSLEEIGFDTSLYLLDFSALILDMLGMMGRSDETFDQYQHSLERHVLDLDLRSGESLHRTAKKFYEELQALKYRSDGHG